jgi:RNA polymerase sigma-70 factor (ECF subfamily)
VLSYASSQEDHAGFRSRTTHDESPEMLLEVRSAIARAKEGDRDAVRYLYIQYSDNVYGYVRSIVRDDHEAEDLTQHVFAKLMIVIGQYDDRGVPFFGWLLRLARNAALDHLRGRRATPTENIVSSDSRVDDAHERSSSIRIALATLPNDQRKVVVMRHVAGMSMAEIADRLGRSESSINALHHRGRRALQHQLRELGSAPSTVTAVAGAH